jgi:hypothetical protein
MRYAIRRRQTVRALARVLIVAACAWTLPAEEVEQFTLTDGREIIGSYDEAKGRLTALTPSGRIMVDVAKEQIAKRKPAVVPDYAGPPPAPPAPAPAATAAAKPEAPAAPMPARPKPAVMPVPGQAGDGQQARDPRRKQMMDLARQMAELQPAIAEGDAAAAKQMKQLRQQLEALVQQARQPANGQPAP